MDAGGSVQKRGGFGCLGYGCLVSVCLLSVVLALVGLYLVRSVRNAVDTYTSPQPPSFQISPVPQAAVAAAEADLREIEALLKDPSGAGAVQLSSDEVSAAARAIFGDVADVSIEGSAFRGRFSMPLEKIFGESAARYVIGERISRFVYGSARGTVELRDRAVVINLSELELSGRRQEAQALVAASEWFSEAVTSALSEKPKPPAGGDALIDRLSELALRDGMLMVSILPRR